MASVGRCLASVVDEQGRHEPADDADLVEQVAEHDCD